ncbi:hypothetical protein HDK64DRAFT_30328 [Phyllosticta capitalensis]
MQSLLFCYRHPDELSCCGLDRAGATSLDKTRPTPPLLQRHLQTDFALSVATAWILSGQLSREWNCRLQWKRSATSARHKLFGRRICSRFSECFSGLSQFSLQDTRTATIPTIPHSLLPSRCSGLALVAWHLDSIRLNRTIFSCCCRSFSPFTRILLWCRIFSRVSLRASLFPTTNLSMLMLASLFNSLRATFRLAFPAEIRAVNIRFVSLDTCSTPFSLHIYLAPRAR